MRFVWCRLIVLFCIVGVNSSACAAEPTRSEPLARIDRAIASGVNYLVNRQAVDGAWRSTTYGLLKDGTSLTPLAAWSISNEVDEKAAVDRAILWMSAWSIQKDGQTRITADLQYPVYAAGLYLPLLCRPGADPNLALIKAWTDRIESLQLNDNNGWSADDVHYGGWGYSHEPPRRPEPGAVLSPLDEPNLSATVFALEGLNASGISGNVINAARRAALQFVSRCQNLRQTDLPVDAKFNDGGFHFIQLDPVRNKPGVAGIDSLGVTRFVSYGSATADGLRALLLCGIDPTDRRVLAARHWLLQHFEDGSHPGAYPSDRSSLKPSLDFYYAASVAQAFRASPILDDEPLARSEWARRLSDRLISRQRDDGSWINPAVDVREDDPLVATPLALRSLQLCREELQPKDPR